MKKLVVTCDRANGLIRAAVWAGKELRDLYVNRIESPDLSGAVVRGKVARVLKGGKAAWIDAGLSEKIYVESPQELRAGQTKTVRVLSTTKGGKAWPGKIVTDETPLAPPPWPWERAMEDIGKGASVLLRFEGKESDWPFRGEAAFSKEPVHPELEEIIESLLEKEVSLGGGASLVIEETEALVAIDVNAGEKGSPSSVNFQAVAEAARQVRLRNLSGIVVIDALKMKDRADRAKLLNVLTRSASEDHAGFEVFGLTKLGLIEAVRARRGPPLAAFFVKKA